MKLPVGFLVSVKVSVCGITKYQALCDAVLTDFGNIFK